MDYLISGNSAVENNDIHRRSSQVSSKTTKTKVMDELDDKVINHSSAGIQLEHRDSATTYLKSGVDDKVININRDSSRVLSMRKQGSTATYQMAGVEEVPINRPLNNQRVSITQSESFSIAMP